MIAQYQITEAKKGSHGSAQKVRYKNNYVGFGDNKSQVDIDFNDNVLLNQNFMPINPELKILNI